MKLIPLISTLVILTVGLSCKNEEKETQETANYKVIQPLRMDTTYVQEYIADIQAVQNIEIRAKVTGFLDKQFIDEGKFVQNGQLLFKLSDNVFKEELQRAKINKKLALTELKALEIELKNTEKLLTNNIVAKTEVELIKIKIEAAKAKLEMADAEVSKALLHVSFTEVKAPFQGVVNRIPFKAGSLIEEGTVLTTLANNSQMYVYFNLSEIDYLAYQKEHPNNKVQEVT
ncbi:MAG: efflux RND transporter periplasmic adaptor subunit, partial [Spirosomataceae bacterium]